jgi:hypothetical protein
MNQGKERSPKYQTPNKNFQRRSFIEIRVLNLLGPT